MTAKTVRAEVMEGIALLTFDVPPRNAASAADWQSVTDALSAYAADPAVRVVVLTGAGHHAFVTTPADAAPEDAAAHAAAAEAARKALAAFPKPTIVRIRGDCLGIGLLFAIHADLLVAAEDSAFSLPGARWGSAYPPDAVEALVYLTGPQHARRLLFTGNRIEAREALRMGLVALVVPDADLSDTVTDLARDIADNAPLAVAAAKRMVANPFDPALAGLEQACRDSDDHKAGRQAMRSGKQPPFQGR